MDSHPQAEEAEMPLLTEQEENELMESVEETLRENELVIRI